MNESSQTPDRTFLGRGWSFPPTFHHRGEVELVADETDIQQSLQIIISTSMKERVMRPRFGCNLQDFVFDELDASLKTYVKDVVETAITYFEPRIDVEQVRLTDSTDPQNGVLMIEVEYQIRGTNTRYNLVYPYHLTEATDIVNR
ncbi:MAG: GPW/gp25 family protein [Bacteroidota bacterium]